MDSTLSALLEQTPEGLREGLQGLLDATRRTRTAYGYDTAQDAIPEPLTMEEMKAGELANAEAVINETLAAYAGSHSLGEEDWSRIWMAGSRVTHKRDLPRFVMMTLGARCWTYEGSREVVERAWTLPEWPGQYSKDMWLRAFAATDFICTDAQEGKDCPLHLDEFDQTGDDQPITLYRGSLVSTKRGMSWTTDLERAKWFARRGDMTGRGRAMKVWAVQTPREATLAHFNHRSEHEVVADVRGLKIKEV